MTEVRYEHSSGFPGILSELGVTVVLSTYQAGKVFVLGTHEKKLAVAAHNFEQPMGLATSRRQMAIGTRREIWHLRPAGNLAPRVGPGAVHDGAFLARFAHHTGTIAGHDIAWCGDELWVVNTLFSCLCTLNPEFNFVPRWKPPFIQELAPQDRCHLNGLACDARGPRYVTALAETDVAEGWRPNKTHSGCILEVPSGRVVVRGLAMPHSPRLHDGRLWVLNSGRGQLNCVDLQTGTLETIAQVPGYTRGLALYGPFAFVGLSRIRETNVFGGLPIAERRDELLCGLGVIDVRSGRTVATFMFRSGVEEIFAVDVVPLRNLAILGPQPDADDTPPIWVVPPLNSHP